MERLLKILVNQLVAATVFCLTLMSSNAYAESTTVDSLSPPQMERFLPKGLFLLDLSTDQMTAIKEIIDSEKDSIEAFSEEEETLQKTLDDVVNKDTVDESGVRDAFKNFAAVKEEFFVLKANIVSRFRAVLTSDQKTTLDEAQELLRLTRYRIIRPPMFPGTQGQESDVDDSDSTE